MSDFAEQHQTPGLRTRWFFAVLGALGVAILATNRWYSAVDDEVTIIDRAAAPVSKTMQLFLSGVGQHEHPPLYDIFLHGWLRLTSGNIHLLRVPATIFYLIGIWAIARTAREIGGRKAEIAALVLAVLSPYGFHFGRVAAWYSFCFLLVALETFLYLKYVSQRTTLNWILLFVCSLALVYSNYFGWALLGLLTLDFFIVNYKRGFRVFLPVLAMGALLFATFLPILLAFLAELHKGVRSYESALDTVLTGLYVLYSMCVSESVAPWFWALGIPAAAAVGAVMIFTALYSPPIGKRFLAYFVAAVAAMSVIGVVGTKRALMTAPWLILAVALAFGSIDSRRIRRGFASALIVIFAIGWFGIFNRKIYAAPHWVEPWSEIAQEAATVVRGGGIVIGNNQSFFFYLTYLLPPETPPVRNQFDGLLPDSVQRRGVYTPEQWIGSGASASHPLAPNVLLVKGLHYGVPPEATDETEQWLNQNCRLTTDRLLVHDIGVELKLRFGPADNQVPWRVEVRSYECR
jgi:hypothetical protein